MESAICEPTTALCNDDILPLKAILITEELRRRPVRRPDYETENRALVALAQALADSPRTFLQTMAEKMLEIFRCHSAGISLLTEDGKSFYWPAVAGALEPRVGGGTPRDFGPCGDVLDCDAPLLFRHPERRYPYLLAATPWVDEGLLVPFHVQGKAVGTIWAIAHDERRRFDAEDLRQLESLARFASAAYQAAANSVDAREQRRAALNLMEDALESRREMERLNAELRELSDRLSDNDRRKNEFLAMLAHELRNPLAPIANAVQWMGLESGTAEISSVAEQARCIIERQVAQLSRIVDDLLEISRITSGRIELRRQRVDANAVAAQAAETVRPLIERRRHELVVKLFSEAIWLDGDAARLEQVMVNLLNNAAKYTDEGGRISLSVRREGDEVALSVRDTGVGIAPDMMPRVFDLFTQVESSLARSQGGLGIGLTLVRRLVEMHGGRVEAFSEPGAGSEFVVRLPVTPGSRANGEAASPDAAGPAISHRVLVVDDNVDAAQTLTALLTALGHVARMAHDGEAALAAALEFQPDAMLLDIGLPGMDGLELARQMRRQPMVARATLIAMTGYGQDSDRRRSREAGFDHHLVKPVDLATLRKTLAMVPAIG